MNALTIVIPVAGYHSQIATQAIASAHSQTVPCDVIVIEDVDMRGAGYARNRGIAQCNSQLITFLDADDILEPDFTETMLDAFAHYAQSGKTDTRYCYSDWYGVNNVVFKAPDPCIAWTENTSHLVTAVVPTSAARMIGGFDEAMSGVEDADFYIRLRLAGFCGLHINSPLVYYREGGLRSVTARQSGDESRALHYMTNRYGGYNLMGCCGDSTQGPTGPTNEPLEGDVLAQAQWHGNRVERGRATGRLYPRTSHPKHLYVALEDVNASPNLWKQVVTPMQVTNGVILQPQYKSGDVPWQQTADAIFGSGSGSVQPMSAPVQYQPPTVTRKKADVIAKAQEWHKIEGSDI